MHKTRPVLRKGCLNRLYKITKVFFRAASLRLRFGDRSFLKDEVRLLSGFSYIVKSIRREI